MSASSTSKAAPSTDHSPSSQPHSEHDARGRFAKGNKGGPGNPFNRQVAALRQVLLQRVSTDDIAAVVDQLLLKAKAGELAAIRLLLSYTVGKPTRTVDPDRIDIQEVEIFNEEAISAEQLMRPIERMRAGLAADILRATLPVLQQEQCQQGSQMFQQFEDELAQENAEAQAQKEQPAPATQPEPARADRPAPSKRRSKPAEQTAETEAATQPQQADEPKLPSVEQILRFYHFVQASVRACPDPDPAQPSSTVSKPAQTDRRAANPGP